MHVNRAAAAAARAASRRQTATASAAPAVATAGPQRQHPGPAGRAASRRRSGSTRTRCRRAAAAAGTRGSAPAPNRSPSAARAATARPARARSPPAGSTWPSSERIGVRDGDVADVHDRGERDVLGVEARFEDRPQAGILAQRLVRGPGRRRRARPPRARGERWRWRRAPRARGSPRGSRAPAGQVQQLRRTTTAPTIDVTPRTCLPLMPRRMAGQAWARVGLSRA